MSSFDQGTEAVLGNHRGRAANSQQSKHPGGGKVVQLNMMQYCNADMELPLEKHFDILHGQLDDEHEIIALANSTEDDSKKSDESGSSKYRPLPTKQPERSLSLLEDKTSTSSNYSSAGSASTDSTRTDKTIVIEEQTSNKPTYHPALRAAVCAEGQEVMWHEDEYSTVSSIMVQPKNEEEPPKQAERPKPQPRHRIPFFLRHKKEEKRNAEESIQSAPSDPVKIHVKRKKVKKSVVLLPQEDNPDFAQLQARSDTQEQAIENMIKARELLNKALVMKETPRLEDSENMARIAFAHAAAARRLASDLGCDRNKEQDEEDKKELENVLNYLSEQGQEAVYQHQQFGFSGEDGEDLDEDDDESDDEMETPKSLRRAKEQKKIRRNRGLGDYAVRAVHYLESMLPKNLGENSKDTGDMINKALSGDDFWSDAGISTLGMNNDTFEYGFTCGNNILPQVSTSQHNMDLMSLSSLNEILDGPMDDEEQQQPIDQDRNKTNGSSPRAALPIIDVPQRKPRKSRHRAPKPGKILGLVTPSSKRIKNLLTPRKSKSIDISEAASAQSKNSKNDKGKIELTIPEEEEYENSDVDSQAVCADEDCEQVQAAPDQTNDLKQLPILHEIKSDSSASNSGSNQERYRPNENVKPDLKLSRSASFKEPAVDITNSTKLEEQEVEWDETVYQRNIHELQSLSLGEKDASKQSNSKNNVSSIAGAIGVDDDTDWDESVHPFLSTDSASGKQSSEPVGKTPRRDHDDIEMSLSRLSLNKKEDDPLQNYGHLKLTPSGDVTKVLDFDLGDDTKENSNSKEHKSKPEKHTPMSVNTTSPTSAKDKRGLRSILSPSIKSMSEKSEGVKSEGSKTKIFGRIVDIMGNKKRDPLVPTAVVEESYVVTESLKKAIYHGIPGMEIPGKESDHDKIKHHKKAKKDSHKHKHHMKYKKALDTIEESKEPKVSKHAAKMHKNKAFGLGSNGTVFDDDTQAIERAVSSGSMHASKSNEEEDDAPPNYLAMMLRKRAKEEQQKARDHHHDGSVASQKLQPEDADSYVAAIRGARHQECPGVALEGVANRNPSRDPVMGDTDNDKYKLRNNLAPTPRRPVRAKSIEDVEPSNDHDPPLNDERDRQRMITARLYAAGSSDSNEMTNHKKLDSSIKSIDEHDILQTVPTVDSAASYDDEHPVEAQIDIEMEVESTPAVECKSIVMDDASRQETSKHTRKARRSFLPNMLKLKV